MTKKDYIIIAQCLNAIVWNYQGNKVAQDTILDIVGVLSEAFKQQNNRFDCERFKEAVYKK